jgi:hypothetical protein
MLYFRKENGIVQKLTFQIFKLNEKEVYLWLGATHIDSSWSFNIEITFKESSSVVSFLTSHGK